MDKRRILRTAIVSAVFALLMAGCKKDARNDFEPEKKPAGSYQLPGSTSVSAPVISIEDDRADESTKEGETADDAEQVEEPDEPAPADPSVSFYAETIPDEVFFRMKGKSFPDTCTTSRDDLRYLHLLYKDLDGDIHEGEMVCNAVIADSLIDIFRQLYENDYPIEKMVLIDDYDGDDDASMADNNTSCFNFREVSGTNNLSKHAYGLAVDLNPRYNPYIHKINGQTLIEPENGADYADRAGDFDYKIDEEDLAYKLFTAAGFTWGGSWKNSKDYQHFQYTP